MREWSKIFIEDGSNVVLRNVGILHQYMASQPRRQPWKPQALFKYLFRESHGTKTIWDI